VSRVVLSLGSNVGDRLGYLQGAVDALRPFLLAVSLVYETDPVGPVPQADYLNAVLMAQDSGDAGGWLDRSQALERAAGRVRSQRWGPRTLDVDLIVVADLISADAALTLPHPRAYERAFVLVPWLDIDPDAVLPGHGAVRDLVAGLDTSGIQPAPGLVLR